jgi:TolB-like protein
VVQSYCEGKAREISQYSIGVEAFGFNDQFDPQQSSVVRMEAGRLRRRLSLYYATEGSNDQLIIDIPKGSYVPIISMREASPDTLGPSMDLERGNSLTDSKPESTNLRVAVPPFQNISGDSELDFFAAGLAEEITSVLSLYKDFTVIPPIAARSLASERINLKELAEEFDARYVLAATIRKTRTLVRIIVQLSDTKDYSILWTSTYDTALTVNNLLDIENEIAASVANSIANEYDGVIPRKIAAESPDAESPSQSTYEAMLRIHHYNLSKYPHLIYDPTLQAILNACQNAPEDPNLLSALAELKLDGYAQGWSDAKELPVDECGKLLERALSLDKKCAYAYYVSGISQTNQRNGEGLLNAIEGLKSVTHSITSQAQAGWFLSIAGEYEEGIPLLDKNLAAIQYYPGWLNHGYFLYHFKNGRYADALLAANQMNMPGLLWDPVERGAALGKLGRCDEGRKAVEELLNLYPEFFDNPRRYLEMFILDDDLLDDVIEGLELSRQRLP